GRRPPLRTVGRAFLIGHLLNNLLPARPGELARAVAVRREAGTPVVEALATTAAERLYDVLALAVLLLASAPFLSESREVRTAAVAAGAVTAAALAAAFLFGRDGARRRRRLRGCDGRRPRRLLGRPLGRALVCGRPPWVEPLPIRRRRGDRPSAASVARARPGLAGRLSPAIRPSTPIRLGRSVV